MLAKLNVISLVVVGVLLVIPVAYAQLSFDNPLSANTVEGAIANIISFLLGLVGILALLALVWGGIKMIGAFGNDTQVADAKKIILWAVIGIIVVTMSWTILRLVAEDILQAR